jgi:hypothetical protein
MLYEIEEFLWYLLIIGIPFFLLGNLTMLLFLMDKKYEWEEKHKKIRKKRIKYIEYLTGVLLKKQREKAKIDVD